MAKGPSKGTKLEMQRITVGVTRAGRHFEIRDDWGSKKDSHRVLEEPWVGYTMFQEIKRRPTKHDFSKWESMLPKNGEKWADLDDEQ